MGFRLTVISPYPFMDASASLRVLHQPGGGDLRHTARFGIDNSQNGGESALQRTVHYGSLQLQIYAHVARHSFKSLLSACYRTASMVETQVTSVTFLSIEGCP
jgi:hypothetical protein